MDLFDLSVVSLARGNRIIIPVFRDLTLQALGKNRPIPMHNETQGSTTVSMFHAIANHECIYPMARELTQTWQ